VVAACVLMAIVLVLPGCRREPQHAYPEEVVDNFLAACRANAGERPCQCAIDRLRDAFPYEQYQILDARMAAGEMPAEVANAIMECTRQ
jgi:hypothetical protein